MAKVEFDSFNYTLENASPYDNPAVWSHTIGVNANLLIVVIEINTTINSLKYNGVDMTLIGNGPGNHKNYYLLNPDVGVHDVEASFASSISYQLCSFSFTRAALKAPQLFQHAGGYVAFATTITARDGRSLLCDFITHDGNGASELVTPGMVAVANESYVAASYLRATDPCNNTDTTITWNLPFGSTGYSSGFSIDGPDEGQPAGLTPVLGH